MANRFKLVNNTSVIIYYNNSIICRFVVQLGIADDILKYINLSRNYKTKGRVHGQEYIFYDSQLYIGNLILK